MDEDTIRQIAMQVYQQGALADQFSATPIPAHTHNGIDSQTIDSLTLGTNGFVQGGQTDYNTGAGFFLGFSGGAFKLSIGSPTGNHLTYDGTNLTVVGSLAVSSLDIPDTTTANSMHVDTSGNTWWGANVASGLANANASITNAGAAKFKNILIGGATIQYQVSNSGIFSFGDGSDGAAVFDGSGAVTGYSLAGSVYTASRDTYFTDATISTGVTVKPNGYRIFGTGTLTLNGTATIDRSGPTGGNGGSNVAGGAGGVGTALADGYLKGSVAGGTGGAGGGGGGGGQVGQAGANTTNSIGSSSVDNSGNSGGNGDHGGAAGNGAVGGNPSTATASNVKLIANWHLATLLDVGSTGATVKFDNSSGAPGGGGGGQGTSGGGGGGGSGGTGGGILGIYFRKIVDNASSTISANGGTGGTGGNGTNNGGGGGGGGAGGNGGQIILVYNIYTALGILTASAGAGGAKGLKAAAGAGVDGQNGSAGSAGTIRQFQISM